MYSSELKNRLSFGSVILVGMMGISQPSCNEIGELASGN